MKFQVLIPREHVVAAWSLKHNAYTRPNFCRFIYDIVTIYRCCPRCRFEQSGKHVNYGSLTSTVLSEETKYFVIVNIQRQIINSSQVIVLLDQVSDSDQSI